MAILDTAPGLEVQIVVDGHAVTEYAYNEETPLPKVKKVYVQAESGKPFQIRSLLDKDFNHECHDACVEGYVDGKWIGGRFVYLHQFKHSKGQCTIDGQEYRDDSDNSWKLRKTAFADLQIGWIKGYSQ